MDDSLSFINGTFFEIMVIVSVSTRMMQYSDYFVKPDWVSFGLQFFFSFLLGVYILFVTYFSIFKIRLWKNMTYGKKCEDRK